MTAVPHALDPARTALVVMDYQNGIVARVDEALPAGAPLDMVVEAMALARRRRVRVAFVRVAFTDDDVARMPAHSPMAEGARQATLHADHPETALHRRLDRTDDDIVVRKTRVGAFSTTDLHEQLAAAGVDTLVLAGLSTSGVVLSTVREAADRDYRLVVLADACADPAPGVHDFLITEIFPKQASVITSGELGAWLPGPA